MSSWAKKIIAGMESAFPKDSVRRLLLQFVFIAVLGQWIAANFTQHTAEYSRRAERRQQQSRERYVFTEDFATAAQRRGYLMSVVIWEVTLHSAQSAKRNAALGTRYEEYRRELVEWNALLKYHQIAISRHFPVDAHVVHETIIQNRLFENRVGVKPDPPPLHAMSEYKATGTSLRQLAVLLQEDLQKIHSIVKRVVDSRLIDDKSVESADLELLAEVLPHLNDRVSSYSELLFRLSDRLDVEER